MSMHNIKHSEDGTLGRNNINHLKFLIEEYQLVKKKQHNRFRFVTDF